MTMRGGMNTWLKRDCHQGGMSMIGTADVIQHLGTDAITKSNGALIDNIKNYISFDTFKPSQDEMVIINQELENIKDNIATGNKDKAWQILMKLYDDYLTLALERTVECQCGRELTVVDESFKSHPLYNKRVNVTTTAYPQQGTGTVTGISKSGQYFSVKLDSGETLPLLRRSELEVIT